MILVNGTIYESDEANNILPTLEKRVCRTLQRPLLNPSVVVEACDQLAQRIEKGEYFEPLQSLIKDKHITMEQLEQVVHSFKRESLLYKLKIELADDISDVKLTPPFYQGTPIIRKRIPLGVLFHIAAGNIDGLPAYSVIEGLLAGNINILKLPSADHGFTIQLLFELMKIAPILADYIYVFDTPSNDIAGMQAMARCANGIVVWGGDIATLSVRKLAAPNTKIIEWGHKISFAYITKQGISDMALAGLAHHMLETKQLLCSSCQGIYIDTNDMSVVYDFCERFIAILERVARDYKLPAIGMQAQLTLLLYNEELKAVQSGKRIYKGKFCSIIVSKDRKLETSFTHGNCWVKALPRKSIINCLHGYKGYLQTVGLLCGSSERAELSELLCKAGAIRITNGDDMSRMLCGETHDGEYPLQRYTKIIEVSLP